jgi:hypothetical protein
VLVLNDLVLVIVLAARASSTITAVAEHEHENRTISRLSRKRAVDSCYFKMRMLRRFGGAAVATHLLLSIPEPVAPLESVPPAGSV